MKDKETEVERIITISDPQFDSTQNLWFVILWEDKKIFQKIYGESKESAWENGRIAHEAFTKKYDISKEDKQCIKEVSEGIINEFKRELPDTISDKDKINIALEMAKISVRQITRLAGMPQFQIVFWGKVQWYLNSKKI